MKRKVNLLNEKTKAAPNADKDTSWQNTQIDGPAAAAIMPNILSLHNHERLHTI